MNVEKAMVQYTKVCQSLFRRAPGELRDLGRGWILANHARMTLAEFEQLIGHLQREFQEQTRKCNLIKRLLNWFGG